MREGWDQQTLHAYLSGFHPGTAMRVRDHLKAGDADAALRAIREAIELHLGMIVEDAERGWIAGMVEGRGRGRPESREDAPR